MVHRCYTISPQNIFSFHHELSIYTHLHLYVRNRHTNGPKLEWQPQTTYFHVFHAFLSRLFYSSFQRRSKKKVEIFFCFSLFLVTALELKLNKNKTLGFSWIHERTYILLSLFFFIPYYTQCSINIYGSWSWYLYMGFDGYSEWGTVFEIYNEKPIPNHYKGKYYLI